MRLPVYTELSNFNIRKGGKKVKMDLSFALVINQYSDPVETLNSLYNLISKQQIESELIIINIDKDGYKYDKLMENFPAMRALIPQEKIGYADAIHLAVRESLSPYILFIDEHFKIRSFNLQLMEVYLTQNSFGALLPLILDENDESVSNIVKANLDGGFLETISVGMKGTALSSLYPKYFCFILNREMFIDRELEIDNYEDPLFCLLDLGYKIWRSGFMVFQAGSFKMELIATPRPDVSYDPDNDDYLSFVFRNFREKKNIRKRKRKMRRIVLKAFFSFRFSTVRRLSELMKQSGHLTTISEEFPLDNVTVLNTVNKDFE